ncbi:MAG: hypothetical protein F6K18_33165 [Okeania sp. SIO2C2]|uniref:hypothetical protein n=1 Tax=Okeania sp. SIO2C2 TaxID=2607787 RepID=UPI0013B97D49|nr:hypothetical protein [Okeania sp. SIO2C2]NEP91268.1 hypothetical protein [Okeania sp. SIO2C2]
MLSKPLDNLFNWNPQLFREIKGRLKTRNVAIAISASLLCQFIVMMVFLERLPQTYGTDVARHNPYCVEVGRCSFIFLQLFTLILLMSIKPDSSPNLWLFSTFPWFYIGEGSLAIAPMLIAIISQWSVLISVTFLLTRKIQKLGASDSQKLLTGK